MLKNSWFDYWVIIIILFIDFEFCYCDIVWYVSVLFSLSPIVKTYQPEQLVQMMTCTVPLVFPGRWGISIDYSILCLYMVMNGSWTGAVRICGDAHHLQYLVVYPDIFSSLGMSYHLLLLYPIYLVNYFFVLFKYRIL